ncbi:MAG: DUF58 domain-containing protein [Gammaproteobacteria bacterium]|jgi:uncharacterized protein (DUF58 family)
MLRRLLFANFKLVYKLSQWTRHRFTSAGTMILLTMPVAGVFGFDTRSTLSFQLFSITLCLLIIAIISSLFFRGKFSIERTLPEYGTVGIPVNYSCTIKNANNKAKKGLVLIEDLEAAFPSIDEFNQAKDPFDKKRNRFDRFIGYPRLVNILQKRRGGSIEPVAVDFIAEKSNSEEQCQLIPNRRGYLYFDKSKLAKADPLGLFQSQKIIKNKDKLLILPKLYETPRLNMHGKRTYQQGGINNASSTGDSQEFISLRDYRPGDPIKSIHWKSFAKTNQPVVKEYNDEFFIRYGLILDTFLDNKSDDVFETAVSIAASFMTAQREQDALLDLMFIGNNTYRFTSGRGLGGTESILEVLACIESVHQSNIKGMEIMIEEYNHECSGLICIFLNMNEERKNFIEKLSHYGIPVKVLVVTDEEEIKTDDIANSIELNIIHSESIQKDLLSIKNLGIK